MKLLKLAVLIAAAFAALTAAEKPKFPLKVSENGRYLVDSAGAPFFINGDSPWEMVFRLTKDEARMYLDTRARQGFNTLLVDAIPYTEWSDHLKETNREGQPPFRIPGDFSTPNEAYFQHLGWLISEAESRGILLMIVAADLGSVGLRYPQFNADGGMWYAQYKANGVQKCADYARFLGRTFKKNQNIVWVLGGDRDPMDVTEHVLAMARVLRETAPNHLLTYHAGGKSGSLFFHHEDWLAINMSYGYADPYTFVSQDYARRPTKPTFLGESGYEGESLDGRGGTPQRVRRQFYWSVLSGACGHLYGSLNWKVMPDWKNWLDTPGVRSVMHFNTLMQRYPWYKLAPAPPGSVIVAGAEAGTTTALAAWTPDHRLAIVYMPTSRTITIDTDRLGRTARSFWYDPASGKETPAEPKPTPVAGLTNFTPPPANDGGDQDWVLVLEQ
jgi:hypothetical protein